MPRLFLIGRNSAPSSSCAVAGGFEVIVDQRVGAGMQRQKPQLLALALDFEMRHAAARMSEIRNV